MIRAEYEGREIHADIFWADPGPGQCGEWQLDGVEWIVSPRGVYYDADRYLAKCSPKHRAGFMGAIERALPL